MQRRRPRAGFLCQLVALECRPRQTEGLFKRLGLVIGELDAVVHLANPLLLPRVLVLLTGPGRCVRTDLPLLLHELPRVLEVLLLRVVEVLEPLLLPERPGRVLLQLIFYALALFVRENFAPLSLELRGDFVLL